MSLGGTVLDIAHRGASKDAPENTLEAFSLAIEQKADMIETDLHLTQDGQIVLRHDAEVGDSEICCFTLEELRAKLPGLITLAEALDAFGEQIPFNLEIKRALDHHYAGLGQRTLEEVRRRDLLEQTLFSSFDDTVLERLRQREPSVRTGLLISRRYAVSIEERADQLDVESVHPERAVTTEALVERLQLEGYRVHVFTVDDPEDQQRLIEWGVDGIFTNTPGQLRALLDQ
jgi:glycerophosphoryl diester phosphodiesterase